MDRWTDIIQVGGAFSPVGGIFLVSWRQCDSCDIITCVTTVSDWSKEWPMAEVMQEEQQKSQNHVAGIQDGAFCKSLGLECVGSRIHDCTPFSDL